MTLGVVAMLGGALALLILGLRGRRVGDEPRCRRCKYNLTGLNSIVSGEQAELPRCPECGMYLASKWIQKGIRRRRPVFILFSALLSAVTLTGLFLPRVRSMVYWRFCEACPDLPLVWLARAGDELALFTLQTRLQRGETEPTTLAGLIPSGLKVLSGEPGPLLWYGLIRDLDKGGALSLDQRRQLCSLAQTIDFRIRNRVQQGEILEIEIWGQRAIGLPDDVDCVIDSVEIAISRVGGHGGGPMRMPFGEDLSHRVTSRDLDISRFNIRFRATKPYMLRDSDGILRPWFTEDVIVERTFEIEGVALDSQPGEPPP